MRQLEDHVANRRVVLFASPGRDLRVDQLRHDRAVTAGHAVLGERRHRDAEILLEQLGLEARLPVAGDHPLAVHFEHAALREAAHQRGAHLHRIDAGLARQRDRLGDHRHRPAEHDLVAGLADLAGAGFADVDDLLGLAHRREDRQHLAERRAVAADHEGERAVDRADLAAAHRRVQVGGVPACGFAGQPARGGRRNRGRVDDDGAWLQRAEDAVFAFEHRGHVGAIRQHRDDDARVQRDAGRRIGGAGAGRDQLVDRAAAAAVHDDVEAVLAEVEGHGLAHEAQTDEANRSRHMGGYVTWEGCRVQSDGVCRVRVQGAGAECIGARAFRYNAPCVDRDRGAAVS